MEWHFDKNGTYLQRRKMFVGVPFHNMNSKVDLEWQTQQSSSKQKMRKRQMIKQEQQEIKKVYNQTIDQRIQEKYSPSLNNQKNILQASNQSNLAYKSKDEDILNRQVELFNHSKMIDNDSRLLVNPENQREVQKQLQNLTLPQNDHYVQQKMTHMPQYRNKVDVFPGYELINRQSQLSHQQYRQNPPFLGISKQDGFQANYSTIDQNKRYIKNDLSLSPVKIAHRDSCKQIQELYNGYSQGQYPFRNVKPDKLENYLRQKVKADHKRAYHVSLNLFKY